MKRLKFIAILFLLGCDLTYGQWNTTGLNNGSGTSFGTSNNFPINIYTFGIRRAQFTTGNALNSLNGDSGDGLRIFDPALGGVGHLDLFTSGNNGGNETHIVWGSSGQVSGQNNRFEFLAKAAQGFWFDLVNSDRFYKFATGGTVHAFVGSNRSWRIGNQSDASNIPAVRKLEVVDVVPQFRLHYGGLNSTSGPITDFFSNNTGNLQILPSGGRVGINLPGNPTANLDVNGDVRIRNVQAAAPNSLLIGVNVSSASDVNVRRLDFPGASNMVLLGNGTWGPVPTPNFGELCGAPLSVGALSANTRINLNAHNFYFSNLTPTLDHTVNKVAVGYNCDPLLPAKFNVLQKELGVLVISTKASHATNRDIGNVIGLEYVGVFGIAEGNQFIQRITNIGGSFEGRNSQITIGVKGYAWRGSYPNASMSYGGAFNANNPFAAYGLTATAYNQTSSGVSYGIYASATGGANTLAGYFQGNIMVNTTLITSDSMFKTNVNKLSSSLKLLQAITPVSYTMDNINYPQMNFDNHLQFGYIAQNVEQVFPNLVYDSYRPSSLDSLGNPIDSAVTYKSLNYTGLIPINSAAIIELNNKVDAATLSDESIKTNIQDLTGSLDKVLDMRGVSYNWNHAVHPELNLDSVSHIGFIAQEIAQIDQRLTFMTNDSLLHVEYDKVVPILAEAIKELNGQVENKDSIINVLITENDNQQTTIDDLNNRLTQLENCLSGILPSLCQLNQSAIQANTPAEQEAVRKNLNVILSNRNAIVLDQNVPNPFAEKTTINFSIPESVKKAQIHFYDGNGRFMNSVELTERGPGSVTVFGSDLSTGVYTYTLVADGQVVATKKMMKQ